MGKRDPRVDVYIKHSKSEFAKPILIRLRETVHAACPDVEETLKWGMPSFMYHGILCGMAAFKQHCSFGFWKGSLILDVKGRRADEAMGQFGRITKLSDLPSRRVLMGYVKKAMELNEQGVKAPARASKGPRKPVPVPADLRAALAKSARARTTFDGFSASNRREYVEWIVEAKRDATRAQRLKTAVGWMAEGKPRNWKYMKRQKQ